jgi:hypothetical protein
MWLGRKAKASEIASLGSVVDGDPFEERLGALVLDADALPGLRDWDDEATGVGQYEADLTDAIERRMQQGEKAATLTPEAKSLWERYQAALQTPPPSARIGERNAAGVPQLQPLAEAMPNAVEMIIRRELELVITQMRRLRSEDMIEALSELTDLELSDSQQSDKALADKAAKRNTKRRQTEWKPLRDREADFKADPDLWEWWTTSDLQKMLKRVRSKDKEREAIALERRSERAQLERERMDKAVKTIRELEAGPGGPNFQQRRADDRLLGLATAESRVFDEIREELLRVFREGGDREEVIRKLENALAKSMPSGSATHTICKPMPWRCTTR